jgi:hypothetical protein
VFSIRDVPIIYHPMLLNKPKNINLRAAHGGKGKNEMNIRSMLQIKNGLAVISAKDMTILVGRKHLSILRAIDLIPEQYLRNEMFFKIDDGHGGNPSVNGNY